MYAFDTSVEIAAPPERVWRALCDPAEVVQWDTGVAEALDAPDDYPQPGQHVRWRYTNGPFRLLHDRPRDVVENKKLRSMLTVGPLRFDETYTLESRNGGGKTLLTAAMLVWVPVPLLGTLVERTYAGTATRATVSASLHAIKAHCEAAS